MGLKQSLKLSQEFAREHTARQFGQLATLQWVHWFDNTRLGGLSPAETEASYWRQLASDAAQAAST